MNLDFLKGNPALNDISPEKLQFLMDLLLIILIQRMPNPWLPRS